MKKLLVFTALLFFVAINANCQEMKPGTNFLSVGIGPSANYWAAYYSGGLPAFRLSLDHGFKEAGPGTITLGGSLGFFTKYYKGTYYDNGFPYTYKYHWNYISAVFRAGYYYNLNEADIPNMNVYGGVGMGLLFHTFKLTYSGPYKPYFFNDGNSTGFLFNLYLGANYFITPKAAIFIEFGYDIAYATIGATFKL